MDKIKYVGIDLHQSTCLIAVHDEHGKPKTEAIVETQAETLRNFFCDLTGSIHVAVEVGTQSGWLYEILKSQVSSITVTDIRDHKRYGNKNDRIDAHKLANWLRLGELKKVYEFMIRRRTTHRAGRLPRLRFAHRGFVPVNSAVGRLLICDQSLF